MAKIGIIMGSQSDFPVMQEAIEKGGTSFDDLYIDVNGFCTDSNCIYNS